MLGIAHPNRRALIAALPPTESVWCGPRTAQRKPSFRLIFPNSAMSYRRDRRLSPRTDAGAQHPHRLYRQ